MEEFITNGSGVTTIFGFLIVCLAMAYKIIADVKISKNHTKLIKEHIQKEHNDQLADVLNDIRDAVRKMDNRIEKLEQK